VEELFKEIASRIALGVELISALLIAYGAIEAVISLIFPKAKPADWKPFSRRRQIFVRFGTWMLLGLEFQLAADVVRSAISPTWTEIGQLAAIAGIRTLLNYFLEKDVEELGEQT
jgi:uncharacterized membrane protein